MIGFRRTYGGYEPSSTANKYTRKHSRRKSMSHITPRRWPAKKYLVIHLNKSQIILIHVKEITSIKTHFCIIAIMKYCINFFYLQYNLSQETSFHVHKSMCQLQRSLINYLSLTYQGRTQIARYVAKFCTFSRHNRYTIGALCNKKML